MVQASKTAEMVAAVRATYHYGPEAKLFDDPFAARMLGMADRLKCSLPIVRTLLMRNGMFKRLKSSLSVLSRARYCEDRLAKAVEKGVRQYVLLGAGLDTFALRADERFAGLKVFELDTADSQQIKKSRVAACGREPLVEHMFVPVDFTSDSVADKLLSAGFEPNRPSFFSWQGVLIYLDRDTIRQSLKGLSAITSAGSLIIADYMDGRLWDDEFLATIPDVAADVHRLMAYTAARGEPIVSGFLPVEFSDLAEETGWRVVEAVTSKDHAAPFLDGSPDYRWPTEYDHLVTLERVQ